MEEKLSQAFTRSKSPVLTPPPPLSLSAPPAPAPAPAAGQCGASFCQQSIRKMFTLAFLMLLPDVQGEVAVCPFFRHGQEREISAASASAAQRILLDASRRPLVHYVLAKIFKGKEVRQKQ